MSRITDYGFLFQTTFGTSKTNLVNNIQLSQMNSSSVQKQLKAAGIDTNSKKYKAALSEMMKNGNGAMFTNVQAIKNLMSQYDKNGDWTDPNTGLTGLAVTDENRNSYKHIISIPESSREEMFELAKKEFLNENGTLNFLYVSSTLFFSIDTPLLIFYLFCTKYDFFARSKTLYKKIAKNALL